MQLEEDTIMFLSRKIKLPAYFTLFTLVIVVLLAGCDVLSPIFTYQGRLLSASGVPVSDGNYSMTFDLWIDSTSTDPADLVCTDSNTVSVSDGLFNTEISCPVEEYRRPLWMEVTIEGETLSPRQILRGAPYANSLVGGAVVQSQIPIDRTIDFGAGPQNDTGAALMILNGNDSNKGGHGLIVTNSADMDGTDGYYSGDSAALIANAQGDGYGAYITSDNYRGMYAMGASGWYDGYFAGTLGIYVNGSCTGCTLSYIAQNDGSTTIEPGDFVAATGVTMDPDLGMAVMLVRKAADAEDPIIGVAIGGVTRTEVGEKYGIKTGGYDPSGGAAAAGEYLSVVVQGLVQARADLSSELSIGDSVSVSGAHAVTAEGTEISLGTVLSTPSEDGLVWILFEGR
jgi:hypothetical protein